MLYRGRGQRVEKNRWYPRNLGRPDAYAIRILCLPSFVSYERAEGRGCYIKLLSQILHSPMSNDFLNFVGGRLVVLVGTTGGGWGDSVLPVTDRLPPLLLLSSPSLSYPPPTLPSEHIFDLYGTFWRFSRTKATGIKDPFPSLWSFFHNSVSKSLRLPSANHVCENRRVAKAFPVKLTYHACISEVEFCAVFYLSPSAFCAEC
ncbi:hypothetical protein ALC62_04547 [Cyphomyrmex costatus]|uniref:Uncharacterized protein n=1 Tax=Cyphomyrmex costatus TaxID=456900 RepID=A0A195CV48_9HYME|nr:hypothetical protein ALC62_04547 [Cyphomyrmex costatus]